MRSTHLPILLLALSLIPLSTATPAPAAGLLPAIRLRSRTITPGADPQADRAVMEKTLAALAGSVIDGGEAVPALDSRHSAAAPATGASRHVLVQIADLPDAAARQALAAAGLDLAGYLPENAFIAELRSGATASDLVSLGVTWLGPITPEDKLAPAISRALGTGPARSAAPLGATALPVHARLADDRLALYVEFHRNVPLAQGIAAVTRATGAEVAGRLRALNGALFAAEPSALEAMAGLDAVKWIEAASPAFGELNDGVRQAIGVNTLQAMPLNIHGSGVTVLVYDGGLVCSSQPDLAPRVTAGENGFQSTHATHVAGTLGGSGLSSEGQYRGMAPAVDIISYAYESCDPMCLYNNPQDLEENYAEGIALHDVDFATNSIGANISANGYDCELLGDYENTARLIDAIARGALGRPFLSIWAAGNERSGFSPCGELYSTTGVPATAKSNIVVGATNSDDLSIADFSSLGPVDDGRMRPDLVAPGCEIGGDGGVTSLRACAGHAVFCGTSMSTPAVAGVAALVMERLAGSPRGMVTLPAAMKAILAASALDLGNPGPDYTFGYGQVDALAAIGLVDGGIIVESELSQGETRVHTFVVPEEGIRVCAVVAWDDEPGEPLSFQNLVNDLDLRLVDPDSVIHRPFVLDPYRPGDLATRGLNRRDPSEMVDADARAGTWRVEVEGFSVPAGPQSFALAVYMPDAAPIAVASDHPTLDFARQPRLAQNVPNPFNPSTSIRFQAGGGRATLRIFDLRGRLVRTLIDQSLPAGSHRAQWDGRDDRGRRVTSGVYLYALAEGGRSEQRRMVLVR